MRHLVKPYSIPREMQKKAINCVQLPLIAMPSTLLPPGTGFASVRISLNGNFTPWTIWNTTGPLNLNWQSACQSHRGRLGKRLNHFFLHIYMDSGLNAERKWHVHFLGPRGPLRTPLVSVVRPSSATKNHATSRYSFSDSKLILFLFQTLSSRNLSHSTQYTEHWTGSSRGPF